MYARGERKAWNYVTMTILANFYRNIAWWRNCYRGGGVEVDILRDMIELIAWWRSWYGSGGGKDDMLWGEDVNYSVVA